MRENVLFEVTKDNLETGLRGIPVGYCVTSFLDPEKGLSYVGIPIREIADREPIELIYLLYHREMGSKEEVLKFQNDLEALAQLKSETIQAIEALPRCGHAMDNFAAAFLIAGMFEKTGDYRKDCLGVIAKLPQIAAIVINSHAGWGPTPESKPELGYIENFVQMLNRPKEKSKEFVQVMKLFNVIHYDHSGGNLCTFVGKSVASGLGHMYGSLAAAMTALAGPRHGMANQECLEFLKGIQKELGDNTKPEEMERLLRDKLVKGEVIVGFGHAVLRVEDPRATVCYDYCQKHYPHHPLVKLAFLLRSVGPKVLGENAKISNPHPNIDAITGTMLTASGFPFSEYYTVLFGLSRCIGIAIQIVYERLQARDGKGTPIIRPKYLYKARK